MAGAGPRGSGAGSDSEGEWRAKRQHLAVPMDRDGSWLDVGCANGQLRSRVVEPGGRLIVSSYGNLAEEPRPLFDDLAACGHPQFGRIHIDRPGRATLLTAWLDE